MPAEDPNQADELLRRYATKRREQAGDFSLHPANRRMLQDEVARQHPAGDPPRTSLLSWVGLWRNRIAMTVAAAAAVIVMLIMLNPARNEQPMRMAKNEPTAAREADQSKDAALRKLAEAEKQLALTPASTLEFESLEGRRSKEKALADVQLRIDPSTRAQSLSAVPAQDNYNYFSDHLALAPTNLVALDSAGVNSERLWAAPSPSGPPQNGYFFGGAPALGGIAPATKPDAGPTMAENLGKLSVTTNQVTFANLSDGIVAATPLPTQGMAEAGKRFGEVAQLQLGSEVEARSAGYGLNRSRTEAEESLARRKLNLPQAANVADHPAKSEAPVATATSRSVAVIPPEQKPFAETLQAAVGVAPLGDARADFDSDMAVFYRQSDFGSQPQVALATAASDKKAVAAPRVLSRFTVEQRGERLRLLETDGSVYEGTITNGLVTGLEESKLAGTVAKDELPRETETATGLQKVQENARSYYFRAAGSNVTLRQNVVVNGRLSASEEPVAQSVRGGGRAGGGSAPVASPPVPTRPASRSITPANRSPNSTNRISTIEGTVRVGLTNEQRFRAVRSPR